MKQQPRCALCGGIKSGAGHNREGVYSSHPFIERLVTWSAANDSFIASAPSLDGCITHAGSRQTAINRLRVLAEDWLNEAKRHGWKAPV